MGTDTLRPPHDGDGLTVPISRLGLSVPVAPPVPRLHTVDDPPPVDDPVTEPLVDLATSGITCLGAYAQQGWPGSVATTWVRAGVAERLQRIDAALPAGLRLAVLDAWRPTRLQQALLDHARSRGRGAYVSQPSTDPRSPAPHLTGGAVDLTLEHAGVALGLGTGFDDFTPRAHPRAFERDTDVEVARDAADPSDTDTDVEVVRAARRLLYWAMAAEGFVVHDLEWWHFEWGTSRWAALRGERPRYGPAAPPSGA